MARKNKSLSGAFTQFDEPKKENETENKNASAEQEAESQKQETDQQPVIEIRNKKPVTQDVTVEENKNPEPPTKTVRDVSNNIKSKYEQKQKAKTVEETHTRATFLFRNDLQKRLDKLAEGKRGYKTMFMNDAIEALLDEMEAEQDY